MIKYLFGKLLGNTVGRLVTNNGIMSSSIESGINYMINYVPPSNKMFINNYYFIQNELLNNGEKIYVNLYKINFNKKELDENKYKDNQFYFNGDFTFFTKGMTEPLKCNKIIINFESNYSTGEVGKHSANYVIPEILFKKNDLSIFKTNLVIEKSHVSYAYHVYHVSRMKYINFYEGNQKNENSIEKINEKGIELI